MNWNEWRGFCSETGLSQEETSESWAIYKNLLSEAEGAAIYPFLEEDDQEAILDATEDSPLHNPEGGEINPFVNPFINELIDFQDHLNEKLSEESDDDSNEETDTYLIENIEQADLHLQQTLTQFRERIDYYNERASLLTQEADETVSNLLVSVRRAMND